MKDCPKCKEMLGDNVKLCFNCHYDFAFKRVVVGDEAKRARVEQEEKVNQMVKQSEERQRIKEMQITKNPMYEYALEVINDNTDGTIDGYKVKQVIDQYADQGWRLHSISTNEVGKNANAVVVGIFGSSLNATIDQTVLIFERCIKA